MRKLVTILPVLLMLSCVSKKKWSSSELQRSQLAEEKSSLEEVLNKLAIENDSLKKENELLDSLYRSERERNAELASVSKKDSKEVKYKTKKSNLSKADEYDKKALYLYNITAYISWPDIKSEKFLIGIVGNSPMSTYLPNYVGGKTISKHPVIVKPYKAGENYQMIFVSNAGASEFNKIKKEVSNKSVLLVTENTYLNKIGSHICLFVDGDKIDFLVNKSAIEKAGMGVNNQLLNLSGK